MLTRVEVTTNQGLTLALHLSDLSNGYAVEEIEGLDPVKANIVSSSFANMAGEQYHSSRRELRNIVFKLGLKPDYSTESASELRRNLYGFFMPESQVRMRFFVEGEAAVDIYGRIETFDCPLFSKEPEATISLICHQPDFYNPEPVIIEGLTTSDSTEFLINYQGTVDSGILFKLEVDRTLPEFTIFHRPADDTLRSLAFIKTLSAGDVLDISTVAGAKGATLIRNGNGTPFLYGVSPYSNWITLSPGPNYIRVYAEGAPVPYTIEYTDKYGGL